MRGSGPVARIPVLGRLRYEDLSGCRIEGPIRAAGGQCRSVPRLGWNHAIEFARSRKRFMMPPTNGAYFAGFRVTLSETERLTCRVADGSLAEFKEW